MRLSPPRQEGFSLLEILVAFSVLALSLGVMMQIYSGSLRNVEITGDQGRAVSLAQSLLASAGVDGELLAGEVSGEFNERFHWRLVTAPVEGSDAAIDRSGARPVVALELWEVVAEVTWGGGGTPNQAPRSIVLATLRVKAPGQK